MTWSKPLHNRSLPQVPSDNPSELSQNQQNQKLIVTFDLRIYSFERVFRKPKLLFVLGINACFTTNLSSYNNTT